MTTDTNAQPHSAADSTRAERFFRRTFWITAVVKFALAAVIPFTSDEAYFVLWGKHLDYGYYDHGAMTGWWLWFMLLFGDSPWLMRLPAVFVSQFVGWSLWRMLRPHDRAKAGWAAGLYLVSPINLFNVLITTDTPLLFFSVVAVMFVFRGVQHGRSRDYLFAGLALGFAFLAKYFAVLLGLSFAAILLTCVGRPRIRELVVLLAGIIPGVGINVAWNYHHSWVNVLFNLVTRQESSGFSLVLPLMFLVILAALAGPGVLRALLQRRDHERVPWREGWCGARTNGTIVFVVVFALPLAAFLVVALTHEIGVHWVLSFFPYLAVVLFVWFRAEGLRRMIRPTVTYTIAVPVLASLAALTPPVQKALDKSALSIALATHPEEILGELAQYRPRYVLTTPSYAKSASIGFRDRSKVPVIGIGSFHGRQDDLLTDFRTLDGRDVMIVTNRERDLDHFRPWFAHSEAKEHAVHGVHFFVLLGERFNYVDYREQVLQVIADRFYRMPPWLLRIAAPSFFLERYDLQPRPLTVP